MARTTATPAIRPFIAMSSRSDQLARLAAERGRLDAATIRGVLVAGLLAPAHLKVDGKNGGGDGVAGADKKDGKETKESKDKDGKESKDSKESKEGDDTAGKAADTFDPADLIVRFGDPANLDRPGLRLTEVFHADRIRLVSRPPQF